MNKVALLLGSNMGERLRNLEKATEEIHLELGKTIRSSSVYETAPWGNTDQGWFLNRVLLISSALTAEEIMCRIILIEQKMGRVRSGKWEPRNIDIDMLFFNDEIISGENLIIPHPRLHERKFTLVPLDEIMPGYVHPVLKKSVSVLLNELNDALVVKKISVNFA